MSSLAPSVFSGPWGASMGADSALPDSSGVDSSLAPVGADSVLWLGCAGDSGAFSAVADACVAANAAVASCAFLASFFLFLGLGGSWPFSNTYFAVGVKVAPRLIQNFTRS